MPHIHTQPGQHDFTTSAYIVQKIDGEWHCLVHMHRKRHILMQVGGHVELDETPWQSLSHELTEEAGYELAQLKLLQPNQIAYDSTDYVVHPVPLTLNTHKLDNEHYHTDLVYVFIADANPSKTPADGESQDIRWLTLAQLQLELEKGEVLRDVVLTYQIILQKCLTSYALVDPQNYSLEEPHKQPPAGQEK